MQTEVENADKVLQVYKDELKTIESKLKNTHNDMKAYSKEDVSNIKEVNKQIIELEKELEKLKSKIAKSEKKLSDKKSELSLKTNILDKTKQDLHADMLRLQKVIQAQNVLQKYHMLDKNVTNAEFQLEAIERLYDQTFLGHYVREKITNLLEPEFLCKTLHSHCGIHYDTRGARRNPDPAGKLFYDTKGNFGSKKRGEVESSKEEEKHQ